MTQEEMMGEMHDEQTQDEDCDLTDSADSEHETSRLDNIHSLTPKQWEHVAPSKRDHDERKMLEHLEMASKRKIRRPKVSAKGGPEKLLNRIIEEHVHSDDAEDYDKYSKMDLY